MGEKVDIVTKYRQHITPINLVLSTVYSIRHVCQSIGPRV